VNPSLERLTPTARKIYNDLKTEIEKRAQLEVQDHKESVEAGNPASTGQSNNNMQCNFSRFCNPPLELPPGESYSLNDFLVFHDHDFIINAYQAILGRGPDIDGYQHYLNQLRQGHLTKIEILGRLRFSSEGRSQGTKLKGLFLPFAFQSSYRIPVLGHFIALASYFFRLPVIIRNFIRFEAYVNIELKDLRKQLDANMENIENHFQVLNSSKAEHRDIEGLEKHKANLDQVEALVAGKADRVEVEKELERLYQAKAEREEVQKELERLLRDKADCSELKEIEATKADFGQVEALVAGKADRVEVEKELEYLARAKADRSELDFLERQKADAAQLEAVKKNKADWDKVQEIEKNKADNGEIESLEKTKADADLLRNVNHRLFRIEQNSKAKVDEFAAITRQIQEHKHYILDQQRRLALLLEEVRKRMPSHLNQEQIETIAMEEDHLLDAMYVSFEDQFRGTREDIKNRVSAYLSLVTDAGAGSEEFPVLDLGCGRGEWLELLKENGLVAKGFDLNRIMVQQCMELNLQVEEQEVLDGLRRLPANSLGAITGMHLIEHLSYKQMIALFDEALRVIKPGGVVIFETPNPENILVGAYTFYSDPTHKNPLPPNLVKFLVEARGFVQPRIIRLHPNEKLAETLSKTPEISPYFAGPQDYAVVAYKAG
jgi:SAM-dependent methyltransferase